MKNREKIQIRLKERGYTQRQIAIMGKVSEQHVCLVIAGKRKSERISKIIEDLTGIKTNTKTEFEQQLEKLPKDTKQSFLEGSWDIEGKQDNV